MARSSRLKAITKEGLDIEKTEGEKQDCEEEEVACEDLGKLVKGVLGLGGMVAMPRRSSSPAACMQLAIHCSLKS